MCNGIYFIFLFLFDKKEFVKKIEVKKHNFKSFTTTNFKWIDVKGWQVVERVKWEMKGGQTIVFFYHICVFIDRNILYHWLSISNILMYVVKKKEKRKKEKGKEKHDENVKRKGKYRYILL